MKERFKLSDTVMYGGHGACTLVEITQKDFGGEFKDYYVLRPVYRGNSIFYVPIDSDALTSKIHPIKTADEIISLVSATVACKWTIEDRARQNELKAIIEGGGTEKFISVYKMLLSMQETLFAQGKKMRAADERVMKEIEKLLLEEFNFSLELEKENFVSFILGELTPTKK